MTQLNRKYKLPTLAPHVSDGEQVTVHHPIFPSVGIVETLREGGLETAAGRFPSTQTQKCLGFLGIPRPQCEMRHFS